jgi:putative SOS response-associated peptidase YedK
VPADFFYDWQKLEEKAKQPYAIELKDQPIFAFAACGTTGKTGPRASDSRRTAS